MTLLCSLPNSGIQALGSNGHNAPPVEQVHRGTGQEVAHQNIRSDPRLFHEHPPAVGCLPLFPP